MKIISYSAPGKVILSGEHAVVYGKPAIVCAIDKRLTIEFIPKKQTIYTDTVMPILEATVKDFLKKKKETIIETGYSYKVSSTIPIGRGLGSSAAYSAVISAGLLELFTGRNWSSSEINMCAYKVEKYFHKNSSGVDTSTSVMGGLIYYRKEFEFLKTISSLSIKIPKKFTDSILLIDTGKPTETTGEMVQTVGQLFNNDPINTERYLNEIEKTTKRLVVSLMKEDINLFNNVLQENELLLEKIGVVSSSTKTILKGLRKFGTGKITGAGGTKTASGYILFASDMHTELKEYLDKKNIFYVDFTPSYIGLKKES